MHFNKSPITAPKLLLI